MDTASPLPPGKPRSHRDRLLNALLVGLTGTAALVSAGVLGAIVLTVLYQAGPAIATYGWRFWWTSDWNPVAGKELYGILPLLYGTVVSAGLALGMALPLGLGTAIVLSEPLLPPALRSLLVTLVDLLAAIPSVVYGLWGYLVLIPLLQPLATQLHQTWGWVPLFSTPPLGPGLLPASMVLAIMILPLIAAISRNALMSVPDEVRQAAFAVGATRWETILSIALPGASPGIAGGVLLALGRALGETMAVTILIGNVNQIRPSLFAPANTIASLLANQFAAARGMQVAALMYAALVLLTLTLLVNLLAEGIIDRMRRRYPH